METLSALDAAFLQAEDSDPHVSLAIGATVVVSGPAPCFDELVAFLAERAASIPRFTETLRTYPFDLAAPQWAPDPDFDITRHVHRVALPQPADDGELFEMMANLTEHRLDRDRPLWELWIIDGLRDGKWAILLRVHHCVADGIAATHLLRAFSDTGDDAAKTIGKESTSTLDMVRLPRLNPLTWPAQLWRRAGAAAATVRHASAGVVELALGLVSQAPSSSLTGPLRKPRRYIATRVDFTEIKYVAKVFGVTVNDVVLAAVTNGYRKLLLARGEQPHQRSLRILVPVSVRSAVDAQHIDNQVSAMLPLLPVEEADPLTQLRTVHKRLSAVKTSGQRQGGTAALAVADGVPFILSAHMIRLLARLPQRGVAAVATNIPGPERRQTVMGREVLEILPVAPIALGVRTAIAMVSYADRFIFGITSDHDSAPDVHVLAAGIAHGVSLLVAIARRHERRPHPSRRLKAVH